MLERRTNSKHCCHIWICQCSFPKFQKSKFQTQFHVFDQDERNCAIVHNNFEENMVTIMMYFLFLKIKHKICSVSVATYVWSDDLFPGSKSTCDPCHICHQLVPSSSWLVFVILCLRILNWISRFWICWISGVLFLKIFGFVFILFTICWSLSHTC